MPKVPEEQGQLYSTQVPGINFPYRQEFGKVGQALSHLGGDVEQAASTGSEIYNEVQRQHAISQSENYSVNAKVSHDAYIRNLKTASPDGFIHENGDQSQPVQQNPQDGTPRTITQEYKDWSNEMYMQDQDKLTPMAAAMYRQKMLPEIGARLTSLNNDAHTMQLSDAEQKRQDSNETVYKEFNQAPWDSTYGGQQNRPDVGKFSDYAQSATLGLQQRGGVLDPETGQLKGGLMNQEQIDKLKAKQLNEYGERWFGSAITKIQEEKAANGPHMMQDISNLLDVVDGKDPQSQAFSKVGKITPASSLTAEKQNQIKDFLLKMIPNAKSIDMSEYKHELDNHIAAAEQGTYPLGQMSPSLQNLMNWQDTFIKTGQMAQADRLDDMGKVYAAQAKGALAGKGFDMLPHNAQHSLMESKTETAIKSLQQDAQMHQLTYTADEGEKVANEVRARGAANIEKIESEKQKDFPGFLAGEDSFKKGTYRSGIAKQVSQLDFSNPASIQKSGLIPQYLKQLDNKYTANYGTNTSYWRPISKDQSATLGAAITAMSPTQQGQAVDNLKDAYGKAFPNLMDTLIEDNSLKSQNTQSADWKFVGGIPTVQGRVAQLSAMQGTQATRELYEATTSNKWDALKTSVAQQWKSDIDVIVKTSPLNIDQRTYGASVLNTATNAVAQMMIQNPGMKTADAIAASKNEAFKGYPKIDTVGNYKSFFGWKSPIHEGPQVQAAFPSNLSDQQRSIVQQNLQQIMTEDGLKKAGASAPKPIPGQSDLSDHFHKMAAENITSINLVNSKNGPGYTLDYTGVGPDGKSNGQINHIMDSKGATKFFPLEDLMIPRNATTAPPVRKPMKTYQPKVGQY